MCLHPMSTSVLVVLVLLKSLIPKEESRHKYDPGEDEHIVTATNFLQARGSTQGSQAFPAPHRDTHTLPNT